MSVTTLSANGSKPRIIIIGAGFAGLYAARTLEGQQADVLLIDRTNYHTFTPLLYQVATCGLEPSEIAYPVRGIFRKDSNVQFLMGEVDGIDYAERVVTVRVNGGDRREPYDYLLIAAGSVTNYFKNPQFAEHAFELKTLHDAVELRNHILRCFEAAALTDDPAEREALTSLVVVGGGASGLETAGALHELYARVLAREYRFLQQHRARVTLIEATDRLLSSYPASLQQAALHQLESLGVTVRLGSPVENVGPDAVTLKNGTVIPTHTLVWLAGVEGSPLGSLFGLSLNKAGRVDITPTLQAVGHERVYVVGDMAHLEYKDGQPHPMVIPVAKQQGILAAQNMLRAAAGMAQQPFRYKDRGSMATIGRSRAVAWLYNRIPLTGMPAWLAWLGLHLVALLGVRNRLNVFVNWMWNYLTYDRSVRLILDRPMQTLERVEAPQAERGY